MKPYMTDCAYCKKTVDYFNHDCPVRADLKAKVTAIKQRRKGTK